MGSLKLFRELPAGFWLGATLIVVSSVAHLWLEAYRGFVVAPELQRGPELVAHTYEVITAAQNLDRALQDAERGQRGYLLTDDPAYLQPYESGRKGTQSLIAELGRLTADNAEQQRRLPLLESRVNARLATLARTLDVRAREGTEAARQTIQAPAALEAMSAIERVIDAIIVTERTLLQERLARAAELEQQGRFAAIAGSILALAALVIGIVLVVIAFRRGLRAEAARHEADHRFRMLVGGVSDYAIYMLDPQGRITDWNLGAERIKGYTASEIIGENFSRFYPPEDREAGLPQRALAIATTEGKYTAEGFRVRKDGTRFLASVLIEPLRDAGGRLIGFAKITRDIGELRERQNALARYAKMDALGQLTGGIAHDFNNLLQVIRNAIELAQLRSPQAGADVDKYFAMALRNVERAAGMTNRLLAFARRQMLDPKPIDPNALVADLIALLHPVLGDALEIDVVLGAHVWPIMADAGQLETAILNLALNARDAMAGRGKLTIEMSDQSLEPGNAPMHSDVAPGQYVLIAVSDTGSGMSAEVAGKAFEPFFTTKETGRGTGLGLSQVYGFVRQSGGHAVIDSAPGKGTTVRLYLPRYLGDVPATA